MKLLQFVFILVILVSCNPTDIKVPVNDNPGLHEIWDNSPVYILLKINDNDTIANVKLGQTISTTKWLVAADKRLKLNQLRPALEKLYKKRRKASIHSDGKGALYFTYLDSTQNKISFVEATKLEIMPDFYSSKSYFENYKKAEPEIRKWHLRFSPEKILLNDNIVFDYQLPKKAILDSLIKQISSVKISKTNNLYLNFDSRLNFDRFLNYYTFFKDNLPANIHLSPKIFIFTP